MATQEGARSDRRHVASLRMRKYRARKRADTKLLEAELRYLEQELESLLSSQNDRMKRQRKTDKPLKGIALQQEVCTQYRLAQLLYAWVVSQTPQQGLSAKPTWLQSTLLADPVGRQCGYRWLSDKLYHNASMASPPHALRFHEGDAMNLTVHTSQDLNGDINIFAMEFHVQFHAVFAKLEYVVQSAWDFLANCSFVTSDVVSCEMVEMIHDRLYYNHGFNKRNGTSSRRIISLVNEPSRAIITLCKVAVDEQYPISPGELRTHGFGWTKVERVTDAISIVRSSMLHYAPLTMDGVATLAEIGRLYGVSPCSYSRDLHNEHIRAQAELSYERAYTAWIQAFRQHLDQLT